MQINSTLFKLYRAPILLVFLSIVFFFLFAYDLTRTDYIKLISLYVGLFIPFYFSVRIQKENIRYLTIAAFLFRAVFLLSIPNLSQDFYRFIWDGRLLMEGWNPYLSTPEFFITKGEFPVFQAQELYNGMGALNAGHYSNYPPLNQLCFFIAALFAGKSILGSAVVMRLLIIAADLGTLHFGKKLLEKLKIPELNIFWYILNPFIIIELTGNLHFEGIMIFFLIWSFYLIHSGKWRFAAVVFACAISIKLIPLMFLPLFYQWFKIKKGDSNSFSLTRLVWFYALVIIVTIILFAPYYSPDFFDNYAKTIALWFQNFEFNASLYYVAREIGYLFRGFNEIAIIGKFIPVLVILFVLIITFLRKNKTMPQLITSMLLVLSFYFFIATTVHPWYLATLLILSVFTGYKFPLVWSVVIILSYWAYTNNESKENSWVIALEYLIVYSVFLWEVFIKKKENKKDYSLE